MALFEAARHEPLLDTPWNEAAARAAIERIVTDTNTAFSEHGLWPIHPLDISPERPPDCLKTLYNGAAGVIWALQTLGESGFAPPARDFLPTVRTLAARHRQDVETHQGVRDYIGGERNAYLFGETGLYLLEWKLAPSPDVENRLRAAISDCIGDNRGVVWGGAGAMLAALFLYEKTNSDIWSDLYRRHFDALWNSWTFDETLGCHLWTVNLYGRTERRLTALHGFLANAGAMLRGAHLLPKARATELTARIARTLRATAAIDGAFANWPVSPETAHDPAAFYLQHCNGAPGVINMLAGFPGDAIDDLLLKGGVLAWAAGPPIKMPCLCHGAPGIGQAFLELHARTGDELWLDRARRFVMHAIAQSDAALAQHGRRKFSLWTGDLGLALFLAACLSGDTRFPTLDYF